MNFYCQFKAVKKSSKFFIFFKKDILFYDFYFWKSFKNYNFVSFKFNKRREWSPKSDTDNQTYNKTCKLDWKPLGSLGPQCGDILLNMVTMTMMTKTTMMTTKILSHIPLPSCWKWQTPKWVKQLWEWVVGVKCDGW